MKANLIKRIVSMLMVFTLVLTTILASTYRKVEYEMRVRVRWKVPEDILSENYKDIWKAHGHLSADGKELNVLNDATVTIKDKKNTNQVKTKTHLPELHITKDVNRYEHQVGDKITYTLNVWNSNPDANVAYWWIKDVSLPDTVKLDTSSIKVSGIDADSYVVNASGNGFVIKADGVKTLAYGSTIQVTYDAVALKEGNGTLVDNTAYTGAQGVDDKSDSEQVYINSPKIDVRKSAPQKKYKVGDVVGYKVEIDNRNPGTFMRDIVLNDEITTPGMEIKEGTVAVMVGGKDVTSQLDVTFTDGGKGFTIKTPYNLKAGTIPCIEKSPYSTIENWIDKIVVTYDAVITEDAGESCDNVFTVPATPNTNGDMIKDDPDIPSGGGSDEESVPMKSPQLEIQKSSNKQTYKQGETGVYTLVVKQIKEELTAKNVVVTDAFDQTEGLVYDESSMKVMLNKEDITSKCNITFKGNIFTINTNSNVTDEDKLTVTYNVKFAQTGTYKNTAVASSDNTNEDEDDNTVTVEGDTPKIEITKMSDKKTYEPGEIGVYTLTVKETKQGLVAEQVVIKDEFEQKDGLKVNKDSFKVMFNETDITSDCTITANEGDFRLETHKDLSSNDTIVIKYQVTFEKDGVYKNVAIASSNNTLEDEDDNEVTVGIPRLTIQKTSDKQTYKIGDTGNYTIEVKQPVANMTAKNVIVKDSFDKKDGMKIDRKSIKVVLDEKDITSDCKIASDNKGFTIETGKNLAYGEILVITYKVTFEKSGTYKNSAKAKSDNTPDADDNNTVNVETPETPQKTSSPDSPSTPTPDYSSPKTGGHAINIGLILVAIGLCLVIIANLLVRRKNRNKVKDGNNQ